MMDPIVKVLEDFDREIFDMAIKISKLTVLQLSWGVLAFRKGVSSEYLPDVGTYPGYLASDGQTEGTY